jgi:hypothetical protein
MNGFRKIFPSFLSHYATFFAKMEDRKVVPFDKFYYQLKLTHLFQKHPVFKMHSRYFCTMGGHGNFAFNLVVKLCVELGYVFLSLRL